MNINQMTVFREVMKSGSLSGAARNLGRTQPAISLTLKSLENDLNIALFLRKNRRLIPVPEAYYLLNEVSEILARVTEVEQILISKRDQKQGFLKISAMSGPSALLLPRFTSDFIGQNEGINVSMTTRGSPQIIQLISAQNIDFGFTDISNTTTNNTLYNEDIIKCHCLCAVPIGDPLAQYKTITPADLNNKPLGMLQPEHSTYAQTQKAFELSGANLNIRCDAQYFLPLFEYVEAGQLFVIVDPLSAESYLRSNKNNQRIVFLPFSPNIPFNYVFMTPAHRPLSSLTTSFIQSWEQEVKRIIKKHEFKIHRK